MTIWESARGVWYREHNGVIQEQTGVGPRWRDTDWTWATLNHAFGPLWHVLTQGDVSDGVSSLVTTLQRLGIPPDYSRRKAASALRAGGFKVCNNMLAEAIRMRRTSVPKGV